MAETIIWDLQIGENDVTKIASSAFGECTVDATSPNKAVSLAGFTQAVAGVTVHVKFTNTNTSPNPTLQIGTSTPHTIKTYGSESNNDVPTWPAGAVVAFTFDGTNWIMNSGLNTISSVDQTYDDSSAYAQSGIAVKQAIDALDVSNITANLGANKTITALSETNGKIAASADLIEITQSQVTNLTTDLNGKADLSGATFTGVVKVPAITSSSASEEAATKGYVDNSIDSRIGGLTGALHLIDAPLAEFTVTYPTSGNSLPTITVTGLPNDYTPERGDVIIYEHQEFVYIGSAWRLLGDEGSYAFKNNAAYVVEDITLSNSLPSLSITQGTVIPNITNAGSAPKLEKTEKTVKSPSVSQIKTTKIEVQDGTLKITLGSGEVNFSDVPVTKIDSWEAGSATTLGTAIPLTDVLNFQSGSGASITTKPMKLVVIP